MPYYIIKMAARNCGKYHPIRLFTTDLNAVVTEYVMIILRETRGAHLIKHSDASLEDYIKAIWNYPLKERSCNNKIRREELLWRVQGEITDFGNIVDLVELAEPSNQSLEEANIRYRMVFNTQTNQIVISGLCPHSDKQLHTPFLEQLNQIWQVQRQLYEQNHK